MIAPFSDGQSVNSSPARPPKRHQAVFGLSYLVFTLACTVWYVLVMAPSFTNDLYWPTYNRTGFSIFIVDLINTKLQTSTPGASTLDLVASDSISLRDYSAQNIQALHESTYIRRLVHSEFNSLAIAVESLRTTPPPAIMSVNAHYCWLDFGRRWSVAHTAARARRCAANYSDNAAIYVETTLRNTNWTAFLAAYGEAWTVTIAWALQKSPNGSQWLKDRALHAINNSVAAEVQFLKARNLTRYELQYQNEFSAAIAESIEVENALQQRQALTLKTSAFELQVWTTMTMSWGFSNDLGIMRNANLSLVRGDASHLERLGWDWSMLYGYNDIFNRYFNQYKLFYDNISPFGSVDVLYVPCPKELLELYTAYASLLANKLWPNPVLTSHLLNTTSLQLAPRPPQFLVGKGLEYFGGNLLCLNNAPSSLPQSQFEFHDGCSQAKSFSIVASSHAVLFALSVTTTQPDPVEICSMQTQLGGLDECVAKWSQLLALRNTVVGNDVALLLRAAQASKLLPRIQFYQYARNRTSMKWLLLQQPLLTPDNPTWSVYGWLAIHDWILGKREVIRLDGDVSTVFVMSDASPVVQLPTSSQSDGAQSGPQAVYFLVLYSTVFSVCLGAVVVAYGVKCRLAFEGRNVFVFNRVACCVWIGRPLLLLRGLTAILILSSTTTSAERMAGYTKLTDTPWAFWEVLLVAGEATWVSYVVNDVLSIVLIERAKVGAPLAAGLSWVVTVALAASSPISIQATLDKQCTAINTDRGLECTAGVVQTGSWDRLLHLLLIQVAPVAVALLVAATRRVKQGGDKAPLLLHGSAEAFLLRDDLATKDMWHLDDVACILTGLVPFSFRGRQYTFDLKLWVLIEASSACQRTQGKMSFQKPAFTKAASRKGSQSSPTTVSYSGVLRQRFVVMCGFVYLILTALGSVSYIAVSRVNLANDFYWATFNMTGHHVVIADWFNQQLPIRNDLASVHLDEPRWSTSEKNYSNPKITTGSYYLLGTTQQQTRMSLDATIAGLRRSDACGLPWVSTQYCWVDFNRQWPMANSRARQQRCLADVTNGAVYLETVLRNVEWTAWTACWGTGFDIAIANELRLSVDGQQWLQRMSGPMVELQQEAQAWTNAGIVQYVVQWQNYKKLGFINTYAIQNALGVQYPMTLRRGNGSYYLDAQTSFKMYWGLASDLWAVGANTSLVGGKSLIATSANYAFANRSMLSVLLHNQTLYAPLFEAYQVVQREIGPFGSVDMKLVPCPPEVQVVMATGLEIVRQTMASNPQTATRALFNMTSELVEAVPTFFKRKYNYYTYGGNILCPESRGGAYLTDQLLQLTRREKACGQFLSAPMQLSPDNLAIAGLVSRMAHANQSQLARVCWHAKHADRCRSQYGIQSATFAGAFVRPADVAAMEALAAPAVTIVRQLNVSLMQYIRQTDIVANLKLAQAALFDPADPSFDFWSWLHVLDWAVANREVMTFQGDHGAITVMSEAMGHVAQPVQPQEMPTTFATYARSGVQYVTGVILGVAGCICVCVVTSRGRIEGLNMFELNRVAGIVWVGRPLLFLRGLTALCLLSTSTLELVPVGYRYVMFHVPVLPWFTTMLGAGEVTWLAYILNDVLMVWTKEYTIVYAPFSSILVWVVAAVLTLVSPVKHQVALSPSCDTDQVDFQLVCQSGVVVIGDVNRFYWLLAIIGICNGVCYIVTRIVYKSKRLVEAPVTSLLLSSGAKYLFDKSHWMHCDVYHMDTASAFLNGLLAARWGTTTYVIDIKLWRWFAISVEDQVPPRMEYALPLTE